MCLLISWAVGACTGAAGPTPGRKASPLSLMRAVEGVAEAGPDREAMEVVGKGSASILPKQKEVIRGGEFSVSFCFGKSGTLTGSQIEL